jgi:hypothetical protein
LRDFRGFGSRTQPFLTGEVVSEVNRQVFSGLQFPLERKFETLIRFNSKRLEVEVKEGVVTIPDG